MIHKPITFSSIILACIFCISACKGSADAAMQPKEDDKEPVKIKYLALGDSYTIGESVAQSQSFPYQLKRVLEDKEDIEVEKLKIVAKTGWTTSDLSYELDIHPIKDTFDLVTLLIGVNNQYRKMPIETYEAEFLHLLQKAIGFAGNKKENVIVISIPDYGATPFGQASAAAIGKDIDRYNAINKQITDLAAVTYINITPISRQAMGDETLVAKDGLHPSGKMYNLWVKLMTDSALNKLKH